MLLRQKILLLLLSILGSIHYVSAQSVGVKLNAKVFLSNVDHSTLLMSNALSSSPNFPLSDPYSSAQLSSAFTHINNTTIDTIGASALSGTGANAIVDWIFVELRQGTSGATSVVATKAGILLASGIIIDTDIASPLTMNAPNGNYFVTVRHRNHMGFRTTNLISLNNTTATTVDFTNGSTAIHGLLPLESISSNLYKMHSGDANSDTSVDGSDASLIEVQNGSFNNYWLNADFNLDGSIDGNDYIIYELNSGLYSEIN
jgi:hypothetical protein